jgi:hypothetical protein
MVGVLAAWTLSSSRFQQSREYLSNRPMIGGDLLPLDIIASLVCIWLQVIHHPRFHQRAIPLLSPRTSSAYLRA